MLANKVYYEYDRRSYDEAYRSFEEFDYVNAIIGRQRIKKSSWVQIQPLTHTPARREFFSAAGHAWG